MKSVKDQMKELSSEYSVAAAQAKLFGSETDSLKAKAESLTKKVEMQTEVVRLNSEQQEKLTKKLSEQRGKQEELKEKVDAAKSAYKQAAEETEKNSEQSKALKGELDRLEEQLKSTESSVGKYESALSSQKTKTNESKAKLMEMKSELKDVNKELKDNKLNKFASDCDSAGDKIETLGKKMSIISGGVAGIAAAAIKTASDFDSSMSNVQAISGASAEEMESLRDKAREMGEKTKFSAMEAGDAMAYMAMAGWKTEDMINGIDGIMSLAAASGEDLAMTSDIVTDAMTAFGLAANGTTKIVKDGYEKEVSNASRFADILAAASSNANTNVALLGESFKYAAPVAGSLGYSAEDTAVALGLMANAGIKASNGGTALRTLLTNLSKPTADMKLAMDYLDISLQNNDGTMKTLMEVMQDLRTSFGNCKMPIEEFKEKLAEVEEQYGSGELTEKEYGDAVKDLTEKAYGAEGALKAKYAAMLSGKTGMSGLLAIIGSSDKDFEKLTNAIYESDGAAQEMADIMQDNLGGQVTILKSQLQELAISIGEKLVPFVRDGVGAIQDIVDKFNSMSDSQKQTILKVGLFTAAVGPATVGIGKFAKGISSTVTTGKKLVSGVAGIIAKMTAKTAATTAATAATAAHTAATTAATATTGGMTVAQTALNAVMNLCPIILIVTLIAGLIAAGVALYKNWDVVKEKLAEFWKKVKETFNNIKEAITGAFTKAKEAVNDKINEIKDAVLNSPVGQTASKVFEGIKDTVSNVMSAAVDTAKEKLGNMKAAYEEHGGGIEGVVAAGWEGIKGYYTAGFDFVDKLTGGKLTEIKDKFHQKVGEIKDSIANSAIGQAASKVFEGVKDTVHNAMSAAMDTAKEKLGNMKAAYEEHGGGIEGVVAAGWEGIKGYYTAGFDFVDNLTGGKLTEIKDKFFGRVSEIKENVSEGWENMKTAVATKMAEWRDNATAKLTELKNKFSEKISGIKENWSEKFTGIKNIASNLMETAKNNVSDKLNSIKEAFTSKLDDAKKVVSDAIERIKGFFNFSWSLPSIKLPHFEITGSFSLSPPSIPHFSVSWYKTGGIMTDPTAFGINGNSLMVGGEAGAEAILPLAEFYSKLSSILDRKFEAVQRMQGIHVENYTYIDSDEVANRAVTKVDSAMVANQRKGR